MRLGDDEELLRANLAFYDPLWRQSRLVPPERLNTWPLVQSLLAPSQARLEVAPGLRPRLPIEGTCFIDASPAAVSKLRSHGARAESGLVSRLPFDDASFDLVAAFDVVEHVDDDDAALAELSRVSAPASTLLLSVPLHPARWTRFDDLVGHRRRYEPDQIVAKLARHGFAVSGAAVYGMQPRSPLLVALSVFWLTYLRTFAIWWYDRILFHMGARFQKKLAMTAWCGPPRAPALRAKPYGEAADVPSGMMDLADVDEILLACRKTVASP
jgi:SAM-dependent methyltransferase